MLFPTSKTEATIFVAVGSLLTGFADCMGLGCYESPSNRTGVTALWKNLHISQQAHPLQINIPPYYPVQNDTLL